MDKNQLWPSNKKLQGLHLRAESNETQFSTSPKPCFPMRSMESPILGGGDNSVLILYLVKSVLKNPISQRISRANPTIVITCKWLQKNIHRDFLSYNDNPKCQVFILLLLKNQGKILLQIAGTLICFRSTNLFSTISQLWHLTFNRSSARDSSHWVNSSWPVLWVHSVNDEAIMNGLKSHILVKYCQLGFKFYNIIINVN